MTDYDVLRAWCNDLDVIWCIAEVVSGCARGADTLGEKWAEAYGIKVVRFPAPWEEYGNAAGPIRNATMGDYADALLAFPSPESKGTLHMIRYMRGQGKPAVVVPIP